MFLVLQIMVGVAQLVEPRVVIPVVVGSSPIVHPRLEKEKLFYSSTHPESLQDSVSD